MKKSTNKKKRNILDYIILLLVIVFIVSFFPTLAKYYTNIKGNSLEKNAAVWQVKINDEVINKKEFLENKINLNFFENEYVANGKVAPGNSGYFDIIIDTTGSNVAAQYNISLDSAELEKYDGLKIKGYQINDEISENPRKMPQEKIYLINDNSFSGKILLNDGKGDITRYRIYFDWDINASHQEIQKKLGNEFSKIKIPVAIEVKQYLGEKIENNSNYLCEAGLYRTGTQEMIYSWNQLIELGVFEDSNKIEYIGNSELLQGDLYIKDGIESIGIKSFNFSGDEHKNNISSYNEDEDESIYYDNYAFSDCAGLKNVYFPSSLKCIYDSSFAECENLRNIKFNEGLEVIGNGAFEACNKIINIEIPSTVNELGDGAFYDCSNLQKINMNSGVKYIGNYCFEYCERLSEVNLSSNLEWIGYYGFGECCSLKSIILPDSLKNVNSNVFEGCSELKSVTIGKGLTEISEEMFSECSNLDNVIIPANIKIIGDRAFEFCYNLKNLILENGIECIQDSAFESCANINKIIIPSSVISIGKAAFESSALESITVDAENLYYDSRDNCNAIIEKNTNKLLIGCKNTVIPNGIKVIGMYAFLGCDIKKVVIPDSVTSIENQAFDFCRELNEVRMSKNINKIGYYAFDIIADGSTIYVYDENVKKLFTSSNYNSSKTQIIVDPTKYE